ncbi:HAD-IA family hydrolase [Candidatus Gottesmanbacteria bacterium]|nr:HAD-IA family hydrolase [Candidatus Gottesmanbacteria bacterium]
MKSIKFIYFDVGSVLLDNDIAMQKLAVHVNHQYEEIRNFFDSHCEKANRGEITTKQYMNLFHAVFDYFHPTGDLADIWTDFQEPIAPMHKLVGEVHKEYRVGIFSNAELGIMDLEMRKGLVPSIDWNAIIVSADHKIIKPEKKIYEIAQKASGVSHKEILFVDDREENVRVAQMFGWKGVVFDPLRPKKSIKEIKKILASNK